MVAALLAVCGCVRASDRQVVMDTGHFECSTVIGEYSDGRVFSEGIEFTLDAEPSGAVLRAYVWLGSRAVRRDGGPASLWAEVNGGRVPFDVGGAERDAPVWISAPVPDGLLRKGDNRIEMFSDCLSRGNRTAESVDMLGSCRGANRGSFTRVSSSDAASVTDRSWCIRVEYSAEEPAPGKARSVYIDAPEEAGLGRAVPVRLMARLQDGSVTEAGPVTCSEGGLVYEDGSFAADRSGEYLLQGSYQGRTASRTIRVRPMAPPFVEPPDSPLRFRNRFPSGSIDLTGLWDFHKGDGPGLERDFVSPWEQIYVPGAWQAQGFGTGFHGAGWYRRAVRIPAGDRRVRLRFEGAATYARVYVNGRLAFEHRDNWSPFEGDITSLARPGDLNYITVRVEEQPGYFSAGFPLEVAMHYGGLWQSACIYFTGGAAVTDVFARPQLGDEPGVWVSCELEGEAEKCVFTVSFRGKKIAEREGEGFVPIPSPRLWSPDSPALYTLTCRAVKDGRTSDEKTLRFGMRSAEIKGSRIYLNGKPLYIRGILQWGVYPGLMSVCPDDDTVRREFRELRAAGFNMVKICLFVMPDSYYDIADETGMLIWQEYPVWKHFPAKGSSFPAEEYLALYGAWAKNDRSHPSVILRDLACEAQDPDPEFAARAYGLVKSLIPDCILEDNSASFSSGKTDFWDWHIYAELPQYPELLRDILAPRVRRDPKPYVTGEDIDCDTLRDPEALLKGLSGPGGSAWWVNVDLLRTFRERINGIYGQDVFGELVKRQNRFSLFVRKATAEQMRSAEETDGYVITALRDNRLTRPGFYDDLGRPKWKGADWTPFNGDSVLLLSADRENLCWQEGEELRLEVKASLFGEPLSGSYSLTLQGPEGELARASGAFRGEAGCIAPAGVLTAEAPHSEKAEACTLTARIESDGGAVITNSWRIFLFPKPEPAENAVRYGADGLKTLVPREYGGPQDRLIVTDRLDSVMEEALEQGCDVIYLAAEDDDTLPRRAALFWRENAHYIPEGGLMGSFPLGPDRIPEHQFIGLATGRPFDASGDRDARPVCWQFNCREGLPAELCSLYETRRGRGRLIACAFHTEAPVAGPYLLEQLIQEAAK